MPPTESRFFRKNFILGIATGASINLGMALLDPLTILPVFVSKLGGSAAMVGLVSALHGIGWFLPQVVASRLAETRRYLINLYRILTTVRAITLSGVVLCVFFIDSREIGLFLTVFVTSLFLAHLAGGLSAVPFLEITSKTIPVTIRGNFFGTRRLIGGIVGILAGVVVGMVLDENSERMYMSGAAFDFVESTIRRAGLLGHEFPFNYGILFLAGWFFMTLGGLIFSFASEEPAEKVETRARMLDTFRSGFRLFRTDSNYRRFFWARTFWQFTAMAFPFYVGFAYKDLGLSESLVGLFLSVWIGAGVFSNYLWGKLLDKKGNRIVFLITAAGSILPPLIVLILDRFALPVDGAGSGWLLAVMCGTFFLNGFIRSGRIISNITYLLEFAPVDKRPLYVGFMNTFSFPFMFTPLLGGVILQMTGNTVLFGASLLFALANLVICLRLPEPREFVKPDELLS